MTSNEIVTDLRESINRINSTLSFQDTEIWSAFTRSRSRVLRSKLGRRNKISRLAYHKICMELIDAPANECCTSVCTVKRSKHQIPSYLHTSNNGTLNVTNLSNKSLPHVPSNCVEDNLLYMPGYKNEQPWDIINGYLYIYNTEAKSIQLEAIWVNPLELLFIQKCENDKCLQDNKDLIQIEEGLLFDIFKLAREELSPSLQIPSDATGDNSEKS